MGNRWFKKDADYTDHPKILGVGLAARGMWDASIGYCFRQESDGWFPAVALRRIADDPTVDEADLARQLVTVGLWHEVKQGALVGGCDHPGCVEAAAAGDGYVVHDYLDYQPSRAQRVQDRADAADRQRRSRAARATPAPEGGAEGGAEAPASDPEPPASPPDTDDSHPPVTSDSGVRHDHAPRDTEHGHTDVTSDSGVRHGPVTDREEKRRGKKRGQEKNASGGAAPAAADAGADAATDGATAHTLIAEYIDACRDRPTDRFLHRLGREIKAVLEQRVDVAEIRQALGVLRQRSRSPAALEAIVNEIRNPPEPGARASPTTAADRHAATRAQTRADMAAWAANAESEGGASPP